MFAGKKVDDLVADAKPSPTFIVHINVEIKYFHIWIL
jgi:hypothetical protein